MDVIVIVLSLCRCLFWTLFNHGGPNKHKLCTILASITAIDIGLLLSPLYPQYPFSLYYCNFSFADRLNSCIDTSSVGVTFGQLQSTNLQGSSVLITGANSGIGFEISRTLSHQGASVPMACRNPQLCFTAVDKIHKEDGHSGALISPLIVDVSDLKSV